MSKLVMLDTRIFVSGADLSGSSNKIELSDEWAAKATTNFRSGGARELIAGLASVEAMAAGEWEAGNLGLVDDQMWANRRVIEPWSVAAAGDSDLAAGNLMYLTRMLRTKSKIWDAVGEVASWEKSAVGSWPLVRGMSAHPSGVPRTATGSGTALNIGAVAAGQYMYANLHVIGISGTSTPSITVTVQSAPDGTFASPTTRATFGAKTTVSGEPLRVAGPFTDAWWRVGWTITGTTPSFLFLASLGID